MSELPVLPVTQSAESIPAALAAPKKKGKSAIVTHADAAPAVIPDNSSAPSNPTAAAPADIVSEEPTMTTEFTTVADTATTTTTDAIVDKGQAFAADLNGRATDAMEKSSKLLAEVGTFTKGNVEALVESGKIVVAGVQTMAQHQAAYVRKQFEEATAAARTMAAVKSPTEFVKLQGDYVRQQFDAMVAETSRSTEAMLKLAGEVVQPISNRVAVAVEKIKLAA